MNEREVTEILGLVERDVLREAASAIVSRDTEAILRVVDRLARSGRDLRFFTSSLMQYLRDVLVTRVAPHSSDLLSIPGEGADLETLAKELSEEDLVRCLEVLTQAEDGLRMSPEPRFHLEMALLKIAQLRRLSSFEELLARFERLASGAPAPGAPTPAPPTSASPTKSRASERAPGPSVEAVEAPPPPAPEIRSEKVEALWEKLKTAKPMLYALISRHHHAELSGNRLQIRFLREQKVLADQLREKALFGLLEEQAAAVFGRKVAVAIELVEDERKPVVEAAPEQEPRGEGELEERAKQDPLVKRFVETFQGEVEDIAGS